MIFDTAKTPPTIDSYDEDNNNNKAQKPWIYLPKSSSQVPLPFPRKIISWAHEIAAAYFFKKVVRYVWCIVI